MTRSKPHTTSTHQCLRLMLLRLMMGTVSQRGIFFLLRRFSCTLEMMQWILTYFSGWRQTGSFVSRAKKRSNPTGAQFLSVSSQENKTAHYFQNLALGSLFVLKLSCAWQSRCSQEMRHPVFYRTTLLHQLMLVIHPETLILERNAIFVMRPKAKPL